MIRRYDPFRELSSFRNTFGRLLDEPLTRPEWPVLEYEVGSMPLDIYEEGDFTVVKASIPGFKPEEIKVEVRDDVLTITGEARTKESRRDRNYHVREHHVERMARSVLLPTPVVAEKAEAVFENGVLTLTLPKSKVANAKLIPVKATKTLPTAKG